MQPPAETPNDSRLRAPATKDTSRERSSDSGDLFVCTVAPEHGRQIPSQLDLKRLAGLRA